MNNQHLTINHQQSMFYRNIRLLILTIILIIFWGLSSFQMLPRIEDPELTPRVATVTTFFPGANAQRVESLVTEKIEDQLQEIEEIKVLESTSRAGMSLITIELRNEVKLVEPVWSRVRDKLDDAIPELPQDTTKPEFEEFKLKAYAMIVALTWEQDRQTNHAILRRRAKLLEDRLRTISGTEEVELRGEPEEEIVVEVNPTDLASLGLSAQQLAEQIQQSDAKVASGQFRSNSNDLLIEVDSELDSLDRVRSIPITDGSQGQFTRLGDIAVVKKEIKQPPSDIAIVNGKEAIALTVIVRSSQRLDLWAKTAYQTIDKFRSELPRGVGVEIIFDQSRYVETRLNNLIFNLLLGALLVFSVTLLMMGWQSAIIVGLALPLSGLMVFGSMKLLHIPLHQMSITGLIVALGLLIDNAIVVVDEVQNRLREGLKATVAIKKSVAYLRIPLLASTLTTVLAFLPIALLSGPTGEFVGAIGVNVIIALLSSLLLSLTIIPALTARLFKVTNNRQSEPRSFFRRTFRRGFSLPWLKRKYRWSLKRILTTPLIGICLALILPITGFVQAANLEEQFFPPADRDQFQIELELPSSSSLKQTRAIANQVEDIILAHDDVETVYWFIGRSAPKFYYNLIEDRKNESNYAQALVQATSPAVARSLIPTLQAELDHNYPEARVLVRQLEQGPPVDAPVEVRIYGSNLDQLRKLAQQLRGELIQVAHVTHTRDSLSDNLSKLGLQVDEEQARLTGLDNTTIAQQLDTTLEGITGGSILESTEELPVRVRLSNSQRGDLAEISSLDLAGGATSGLKSDIVRN